MNIFNENKRLWERKGIRKRRQRKICEAKYEQSTVMKLTEAYKKSIIYSLT